MVIRSIKDQGLLVPNSMSYYYYYFIHFFILFHEVLYSIWSNGQPNSRTSAISSQKCIKPVVIRSITDQGLYFIKRYLFWYSFLDSRSQTCGQVVSLTLDPQWLVPKLDWYSFYWSSKEWKIERTLLNRESNSQPVAW